MGKTTEVAADRAYDHTKTVLPAEVARGTYMQNAPGLAALKMMHLLIGKAGGRMGEDVQHHVRLSEVREVEGLRHHDRTSLTPLFAELQAAVLISDDTYKNRLTIGGLLDVAEVDYSEEEAGDLVISWYFSRMFTRAAAASNHWAILDRQTVFHLGSKYSVLLFQHIASLAPLDRLSSKTFTVADLRALFGLPEGKHKRFAELNRWAIKPAVEEINQLSRLHLTATTIKRGRSVTDVIINWEVKEDPTETKRELDRPKVGRKARRDGSAEAPPLSFPATGSVKGDTFWEPVARDHVTRIQGGHVPDLRGLTDAFRNWCEAKGIPLDARAIDKTFIGFCRSYKPLL